MRKAPRKYRTAEQLSIAPWERKGLLKTLKLLRTGLRGVENVYAGVCDACGSVRAKDLRFNMGTSSNRYDCGTALCIGGYVKLFDHFDGELPEKFKITRKLEKKIDNYVGMRKDDESLGPLYFPRRWGMSSITSGQGVHAIETFLATGRPEWRFP